MYYYYYLLAGIDVSCLLLVQQFMMAILNQSDLQPIRKTLLKSMQQAIFLKQPNSGAKRGDIGHVTRAELREPIRA